jgi:dihydrofolate reductase
MHVVLLAAQSVDGFITQHDIPGTDFTSSADKDHFRRSLAEFDCSIFGAVTYQIARDFIRPRLDPGMRRIVMTRDRMGYETDAVPGRLEFTEEQPVRLVHRLNAEGHQRCALLGGSQIHSLFLAAGLVNEMWLTLEPRLFGSGTPLLARPANVRLELISQERLGESNSVLVKYRVQP